MNPLFTKVNLSAPLSGTVKTTRNGQIVYYNSELITFFVFLELKNLIFFFFFR